MSRFVVPKSASLVAATPTQPDGPLGRIVKYVPTEIVTIFTMFVGGMASFKIAPPTAQRIGVGAIIAFLITTIIFMAVRAPVGTVKRAHLIVSPLAFLAWAYPISSALLGGWFIGYIAFLIQIFMLLLALIVAPS